MTGARTDRHVDGLDQARAAPGARRSARYRPRPASRRRAARRAWCGANCRSRSARTGRSRRFGPPGCLRRASSRVSTSRSRAISLLPQRSSSALRKPRSNVALWVTSGASPMKARKSSHDLGEERLVLEEVGRQAVHRERLGRHVALRIEIAVEVWPVGNAVEQLDAADLDQPMPLVGIEAGGLGIEHDLAHRSRFADCALAERSAHR